MTADDIRKVLEDEGTDGLADLIVEAMSDGAEEAGIDVGAWVAGLQDSLDEKLNKVQLEKL